MGWSQGLVQKGLQECLHISHCGIPWPLVSHSINFFSSKAPENTEDDPDDSEPADEGDTQVEHSPDLLYSPSIGAVTKDYLYKFMFV